MPAALTFLCAWFEERRGVTPAAPNAVIGITGPVGSGKSYLAGELARLYGGVIVPTDMYLPDYDPLPEHERDEPRHAEYERAGRDLKSLRDGAMTSIPVWSFHSHSRVGESVVHPAKLIICEGIHALHPAIAAYLDLAVYVDAKASARWNRWEQAELSGERGWGVDKAKHYFTRVADPTFARYERDYVSRADLLVSNEEWMA
jgi:uridine kinase